MVDFSDFIGLMGVILMLYAYGRIQFKREYAKQMRYSVINLIGSGCLVFSLWQKWNMASFTGNMIWVLISIYGIFRCAKYMRRPQGKKSSSKK